MHTHICPTATIGKEEQECKAKSRYHHLMDGVAERQTSNKQQMPARCKNKESVRVWKKRGLSALYRHAEEGKMKDENIECNTEQE